MSNLVQPFDFYLLRVPLLPLGDLLTLHAQSEPAHLIEALHARYQEPLLQEAIYLASPELYQRMVKWLARPANDQSADNERLVLTLYKYLVRMCTRCTPYGLFAGFATGRLSTDPSHWQLAPAAKRLHRNARLDMNYVAELAKQIEADPHIRAQLRFNVNSSLYRTPEGYRYYEYRMRNKRRHYQLVAVKASAYVDLVLTAAKPGASYTQLLAQLMEQDGVTPATAARFLDRLIESQLLLSELEPTVTGPEFYHHLVARVATLSPQHPSLTSLREIQTLLTGPGVGTAAYQAVEAVVHASLPAATSRDLVQTDLRLNLASSVLNDRVAGWLGADLQAAAALHRSKLPADIQTFINRFSERYEEQEVPLLEALDSEAGLGYGTSTSLRANYTPLIDDMRVPGKASIPAVTWTPYRRLLLRKLQESQQQGLDRVKITAADLASLAEPGTQPAPLPASFYAIGSVVAANAAALDTGDFQFHLIACHGPGALILLSRFAPADPILAAHLAEAAQREQQAQPDVLLAEVVHLPEARAGNVLQRPALHSYEIPFLGASSVPATHQLPVTELLVSVRHGRVVLRSARTGQVIVPRLTTAHNYSAGLPVYKFLGDLQSTGDTGAVLWDWGVLGRQAFLPRVECGRLILSRAQWNLPASAASEVGDLRQADTQAAFRQRYGLPARVVLADGDNELLLDLACSLAWELLAQRLKKGPTTLLEFVHDPASTLLTDERQAGYANEVILPFTTVASRPRRAVPPIAVAASTGGQLPVRSFALGSEWTYLKVYCGPKWAERILTEYLRPCLLELEATELVAEWFFVRYADPRPHLRLRLRHRPEPATVATIVSRLHQALAGLQQARVVQALQYDTYHRELERYGAAPISFSETVFGHDSRAVLQFLDLLSGDAGERYRWLFALRGVDQLLTDFGLSLPEKAALAVQSQQDFFAEFNGNATLTRRLNDKYREVSRELTDFLHGAEQEPELVEAVRAFATRSAAIQIAVQDLVAAHPTLDVGAAVRRLLPSYLHMFLNRMFLANQRLHELVVYHYLVKYYATAQARSRQLVAACS